MNKHQRLMAFFSLLTALSILSSCSKPIDLDTPCPDYGKQCSQASINLQPI